MGKMGKTGKTGKMAKGNKNTLLSALGGLVTGVIVTTLSTQFIFNNDKDFKVEDVAKVGSTSITTVDLYDAMKSTYGATVVENLISDEIVKQESKDKKLKVSDDEVKKELDGLIAQYGGDKETFNAQLKEQGKTLETIKEDIVAYIQLTKILEERVEITDEEIKTYFEANKDKLGQAEAVQVSHILVETEEVAKKVIEKLNNGANFAELAKEYSQDTGTSKSGGDLGFISKGETVEAFEKAAFSTEIGSVTSPVESDYGYHIIKVTAKQEAKEAELKSSTQTIKDALMDKKMTAEYTTWYSEMTKKYKVDNNLSDKDNK